MDKIWIVYCDGDSGEFRKSFAVSPSKDVPHMLVQVLPWIVFDGWLWGIVASPPDTTIWINGFGPVTMETTVREVVEKAGTTWHVCVQDNI